MILLENWSVVDLSEGYSAPEARKYSLSGEVYKDTRFANGTTITTSQIVEIHGRLITTRSGTIYKLGRPSAMYRTWVKDNYDIDISEDNPIKFVRTV